MECRIYDPDLTPIGSVSNFVSLVWEEGYTDAGVFQLVTNKTPHTIELLKEGRFVGIPDSDTIGFIRTVDDKSGRLWVYGIEAKGILSYRIVTERAVCNNANIETRLRYYVGAYGDFDILALPNPSGLTGTTDSEYSYASIFELSRAWCTRAGYGFRLVHDNAARKLYYTVYEGENKNDFKFSRLFGNMADTEYVVSGTDFYNVAYVAGAGSGTDRVRVLVDASAGATGLDRRVMFVDARDIQKQSSETEEQYEARLTTRGLEKLAEHQLRRSVSFRALSRDYGEQFRLGDSLSVSVPEHDYTATVRIEKVRYTYENNVRSVDLTLGTIN